MRHDTGALADFVVFTPFTASEVATALGVSLRDVMFAISDGTLKASVRGVHDPFSRMRAHSFWDIVEFELLLRAGWPLCIDRGLRRHIDETCDDLAVVLEDGPDVLSERGASRRYDADQRQARLPDYLDQMGQPVMSELFRKLWIIADRQRH